MFSFICAWIKGWVNNGEAGDLRCRRAHYDVIVMQWCQPLTKLYILVHFKEFCNVLFGIFERLYITHLLCFVRHFRKIIRNTSFKIMYIVYACFLLVHSDSPHFTSVEMKQPWEIWANRGHKTQVRTIALPQQLESPWTYSIVGIVHLDYTMLVPERCISWWKEFMPGCTLYFAS